MSIASDLRRNISNHLEAIGAIGSLGLDKGYFRPAYSDLETQAMNYFQALGEQSGFSSRWDLAGNLFLEFIPSSASQPFIEFGSHLDTVPSGGNYDGVAGVIAGFETMRLLKDGQFTSCNLRLRIWRAEEGAIYGGPYKGSRAAFAELSSAALDVTFAGKSLRQAMQEQEVQTSLIEQGQRGISQQELDQITAHLELHIEQGTCLENAKADIGIVSGIRGATRELIQIFGEFNHSGATPLGIEFRRDANLALAHIIVELDKLSQKFLAEGKDLVQTVSLINSDRDLNSQFPGVYQNSITKVSGYAYFCLDVRSCDPEVCEHYQSEATTIMQDIARRFRVGLEKKELSKAKGIKALNAGIRRSIKQAADTLELKSMHLASGAGHDAAIVAKQKKSNGDNIPAGMIFIPCLNGISHSPLEYSTIDQIATGTLTLALCTRLLATENQR